MAKYKRPEYTSTILEGQYARITYKTKNAKRHIGDNKVCIVGEDEDSFDYLVFDYNDLLNDQRRKMCYDQTRDDR